MNVEFEKAAICGFFAFVTLLFLLGLVPSLVHLIYKRKESLRRRLVLPILTALITAFAFVLPIRITDQLLGLAGVIVALQYFIRRSGNTKRDVA